MTVCTATDQAHDDGIGITAVVGAEQDSVAISEALLKPFDAMKLVVNDPEPMLQKRRHEQFLKERGEPRPTPWWDISVGFFHDNLLHTGGPFSLRFGWKRAAGECPGWNGLLCDAGHRSNAAGNCRREQIAVVPG